MRYLDRIAILFLLHLLLLSMIHIRMNTSSGGIAERSPSISSMGIASGTNFSGLVRLTVEEPSYVFSIRISTPGVYIFHLSATYTVPNNTGASTCVSVSIYEKHDRYSRMYSDDVYYWEPIVGYWECLLANTSDTYEREIYFRRAGDILATFDAYDMSIGFVEINYSLELIFPFQEAIADGYYEWGFSEKNCTVFKLTIGSRNAYRINISQTVIPIEFDIVSAKIMVYLHDIMASDTIHIYVNGNYLGKITNTSASFINISLDVPPEWLYKTSNGSLNVIELRYEGDGSVYVDWVFLEFMYENGYMERRSTYVSTTLSASNPTAYANFIIYSLSGSASITYELIDSQYARSYVSTVLSGNGSAKLIAYLDPGEYYIVANRDMKNKATIEINITGIGYVSLSPNQTTEITLTKDTAEPFCVVLENFDSKHLYRLEIQKLSGEYWSIYGSLYGSGDELLRYDDTANMTVSIDDMSIIMVNRTKEYSPTGVRGGPAYRINAVEIISSQEQKTRDHISTEASRGVVIMFYWDYYESSSQEFTIRISFSIDGEIVTINPGEEAVINFQKMEGPTYCIIGMKACIGKKYRITVSPTKISDGSAYVSATIMTTESDWIIEFTRDFGVRYFESTEEYPIILEYVTTYRNTTVFIVISVIDAESITVSLESVDPTPLDEQADVEFGVGDMVNLLSLSLKEGHTYRIDVMSDRPNIITYAIFFGSDGSWPFMEKRYGYYWGYRILMYWAIIGNATRTFTSRYEGTAYMMLSSAGIWWAPNVGGKLKIRITDLTSNIILKTRLIGIAIGGAIVAGGVATYVLLVRKKILEKIRRH